MGPKCGVIVIECDHQTQLTVMVSKYGGIGIECDLALQQDGEKSAC